MDLATLGVRKAQLNGGMHHDASNPGRGIDTFTDNLNQMVAQLELAIVKHPQWWDLADIVDLQLLSKVFEEVISFENSFLERARSRALGAEQAGGDGSAGGSEDSYGSDDSGGSSAVVGKEVHSALEP
jgi:hypothetical protein